jgi:outer membrane protein
MLNKTIIGAVSAIILSSSFMSANAADVSIGTVDSNVIVARSSLYSALRKSQEELGRLDQNLQKDYQDKMAKLSKAKTKEEFEKLQRQYGNEFRQKQEQAYKTLMAKRSSLDSMKNTLRMKVESAIKEIAKKKKLTHVVAKEAMYFGGIDITNDVLARVK